MDAAKNQSVNYRNIKSLTIEIYKIKNNLVPMITTNQGILYLQTDAAQDLI